MSISNIASFTVLLSTISTAVTVQYMFTQIPARVAIGEEVTLDIQIKDFVEPLGEVQLNSNSNGVSLFNFTANGQCTLPENSNLIKSVVLCDNKNSFYTLLFNKLTADSLELQIVTTSQQPLSSNTFDFETYVKPDTVVITQGKSLVTTARQKVQLNCSFSDGTNNKASFKWKRVDLGGSDVALPVTAKFSSTKEESEINWISLKEDSGWYECIADYDPSSVGRFKSDRIKLDVQYTPRLDLSQPFDSVQIAEIGDKVRIIIAIISNPPVSKFDWHWQKSGKSLDASRFDFLGSVGQLSFTVEESDYGVYELEVRNDLGWSTFYVEIHRPDVTTELTEELGVWHFTTIALAIASFILLMVIIGFAVCFCYRKCHKEDPYARRIVEKTEVSDTEMNGIDNIDDTYMDMMGGSDRDGGGRPSAQIPDPEPDYVAPSEFMNVARPRPQVPPPPPTKILDPKRPTPTVSPSAPPKPTKSKFGRFKRPKQADPSPDSAPSTPPPPVPKNANRPLPTPTPIPNEGVYELDDPSPVRNMIGWMNNKNE